MLPGNLGGPVAGVCLLGVVARPLDDEATGADFARIVVEVELAQVGYKPWSGTYARASFPLSMLVDSYRLWARSIRDYTADAYDLATGQPSLPQHTANFLSSMSGPGRLYIDQVAEKNRALEVRVRYLDDGELAKPPVEIMLLVLLKSKVS